MSGSEYEGLDSEELLQLAVLDSAADRHDTAIVKLKKAVALDPRNAKALYMLGAEHAEIGLMERAIEEMTRALEVDPALETAHFQLGLLLYSLGRVPEASDRWDQLSYLGDDHPLVAFKTGLLLLNDNKLEEAELMLVRARDSVVSASAPLRADIEKVLANTRRHREQLAGKESSEASGNTPRISGAGLAQRYGDLDA